MNLLHRYFFIFSQIQADFSLFGPIVLEWLVRTKLSNAQVYGFVFDLLPNLNISRVDKAEEGARQTNAWASAQPACLDELLFNLVPEEFEQKYIGKTVEDFANRVAAFVANG